jgi:hypothetical protein
MPGKKRTIVERQIIGWNAKTDETREFCNARLQEAGFREVCESSWKTWVRENTGYAAKLNTNSKLRHHVRSPQRLGDL